jgi:hypothetical protein
MLSLTTLALALSFAPSSSAENVDRPWALQIGLGPQVGLPSGGVQGKLVLDFQNHLKHADVGPALGLQTHMHFARGLFGMDIGPMFLWDFRVVTTKKFKLYVAPMVALGYTFTTIPAFHATAHGFFMDFGAQVKGMVNDRVGFFVRPATFSVIAGKGGAAGAYAFVAGVALMF